jgi:hypothetical protein
MFILSLAFRCLTWCWRSSSLRDCIILAFLAAFFAVQGWIIWRVLLSPVGGARSRRALVRTLQGLDPLSQEFYAKSSGYFWQRARATRSYGRFFVLLAIVSVALVFVQWQNQSLVLLLLPGYLFSGFVGLVTIDGALRTMGLLAGADRESNTVRRTRLLREVALRYRGDAVAVRALRLIDEARSG